MSKLASALIFVLGVATGVGASYKYFQTRYQQIAEDEIEEIRAAYRKKEEEAKPAKSEKGDDTVYAPTKQDLREYAEKLRRYTSDSDRVDYNSKMVRPEDAMLDMPPYIISPDEFGEEGGYETVTLMWYADHVLCDDMDVEVEDVDNTVGTEWPKRFGEYEAGTVFVRNDRLQTDYEICIDLRNYRDVVGDRYTPR